MVDPSLVAISMIQKKRRNLDFRYTCMSNMAMSKHKNSRLRGNLTYNSGRTFLSHHDYTLSLSDIGLVVEKILKEKYVMHLL